jgi:Plasmid encoded RepA protein
MGDETLPIRSSGLTKDDIALMVHELVLVTLPHKDPGDVPEWIRRNGNITLAIQPGYKDDPKDNRRRVCIGYPYGSTARLILYWIVTETRRTGEPRLELGKSLADFMRKLGITPDDSTGKRSSAHSVHRQLERLMHARIRFEQCQESDGGRGWGWLDMPVAKAGWLWWDAKEEEQKVLCNGYIILNDDFFKTILANPVPVRMMTLLALKKSPLGLDLYAWATIESYKAQHHRKGRFVAWKLLHEQFGTELGTIKNFAAKAQRELRKIMCNCPTIKLTFQRGGVQVLASSLPDVPPRAAHEALQQPSAPAKAIPSGKAIEHVMHSMKTRESAVIIATAFQKAVERGEVENTDEAYISFANQYVA